MVRGCPWSRWALVRRNPPSMPSSERIACNSPPSSVDTSAPYEWTLQRGLRATTPSGIFTILDVSNRGSAYATNQAALPTRSHPSRRFGGMLSRANFVARATLVAGAAVVGIGFEPLAHSDDADFIQFLTEHGLGCGEGSIKCKSADDLIQLGHSVCYDIDVNGQTPGASRRKGCRDRRRLDQQGAGRRFGRRVRR